MKKIMAWKLFPALVLIIASFLETGCAGNSPLGRNIKSPVANAGFATIWNYASSLEDEVKSYSGRRFGSYPEGLRKAVQKNRLDFLSSGAVSGNVPELQSFLFFEYRRQRGLYGEKMPVKPDANTEKYIRALLVKICELKK